MFANLIVKTARYGGNVCVIVVKVDKTRRLLYSLLNNTLKRTRTLKTGSTETVLGYNSKQLKAHLESKFLLGMSWDNHGSGPCKWNIDHIKPVSVFVREGVTDLKNY